MHAGITVGGLTNGRMLIAQSAIDSLKIGTSIAIRYALLRPQFGDTNIMSYVTHQTRLLPSLADAYALHLGMGHLKNFAFSGAPATPETGKQLHVMSAGLKAASTWSKVDGLQKCRECCGGQGFLAINKIGPMAVDTNVDATFEGDNTVMMQQVAKALVDAGMKAGGAQRPAAPRLPALDTLGAPSAAAADSVISLLQFRCARRRPNHSFGTVHNVELVGARSTTGIGTQCTTSLRCLQAGQHCGGDRGGDAAGDAERVWQGSDSCRGRRCIRCARRPRSAGRLGVRAASVLPCILGGACATLLLHLHFCSVVASAALILCTTRRLCRHLVQNL